MRFETHEQQNLRSGHFAIRFDPDRAEQGAVAVRLSGFVRNVADIARQCDAHQALPPEQILYLAYMRLGPDFLQRLQGEFFIAIADSERKRLVFVRDQIGLRAGFIARLGRELIVSSQMTRMLSALGGPPQPDPVYIAQSLVQGQASDGRTIDSRVRLFPAGHVGHFDGNLTRISCWDIRNSPDLDKETLRHPDEAFRDLVATSVAEARGPRAAVELSGGLDSSTVFSILSEMPGGCAGAISFVYSRSKSSDERDWIKIALDAHPTKWKPIDEDLVLPFSILPKKPEDPGRMMGTHAGYLAYCDAVQEIGANVILSGFGGDQVLGGDIALPIYSSAPAWSPVGNPLGLREWQNRRGNTRPFLHYLRESVWKPRERHRRGLSITGVVDAARLPWLSDAAFRISPWGCSQPGASRRCESLGDQFYWESIWRIQFSVPGFWNQYEASFDIRHPLLDLRPVEFMFRLPWKEKLNAQSDRVLQRRALSGHLGRIARRRDKRGPDECSREGLRRATNILDVLETDSELAKMGMISPEKWHDAIRRVRVGCGPPEGQFTAAVCLEIWLQKEAGRLMPEMSQGLPKPK